MHKTLLHIYDIKVIPHKALQNMKCACISAQEQNICFLTGKNDLLLIEIEILLKQVVFDSVL